MNIDIRTIVLVLGITHLIQVAVFSQQYKTNKNYQGVGWWLLWSIAEVVGFAGLILRDIPSIHLIAIIIQNSGIFLGTIFVYIGVMRFLDKKVNPKIIFSVSTSFIIAIVYFTYVHDNAFMRSVIFNAAVAGTSLLTAYVLLVHKMPSIASTAHFIAVVFLVHGGVFTYRTVMFLSGAPVDDIFRPTLFNYLPVLDALIVSLLWTFGLIIMVNQRLNAENSETNENMELIFNTSPDAVLVTRLTDGYFININDGFTVLTGYTRAELIGKSTLDINLWKNPVDRRQLFTALTEKGFCENLEAVFQRKDGSQITAMVSAKIITMQGAPYIISVTRDITERKQAEAVLQESEQHYRTLFDQANEGLLIMTPAGQLFEVNQAFAEMHGYTVDELKRKDIRELDALKDKALTDRTEILRRIQAGEVFRFEVEHYHKDGHTFPLTVTTSMIQIGDQMYYLAFHQDISERRQAEAKKAELESQNRQLQKAESLGRMAASIAHHFNNQLGVVIGNLEMAIDEQPKGAAPSRSLTSAMEAAWKSADMSGLMLTYLGQSRDKREPLDLAYSCHKILPMLKAAMPENVILETDFSSPGPVINTSHDYMQQILTNLLTNAWEAIGKSSGTISLSVKTVSPAQVSTAHRFPIDWQQQDNAYACMEVTDTGCGIEDKDIEKLFDPFYSTKFTGRGMGLAVVLGLANSHKGVITVDSKPGKGSTFRLFFPASEEALLQPQKVETKYDALISKVSPGKMEEGGTVLVVEDEEPLRKMVAIMLERLGFSVLEAKDGIDALELFGQHQSEIKLVISDLTMPRMNGWETLNALRKLQPDIPVILASGYDLGHVMSGVHPELPQAFLGKPYNLKALSDAIKQALEKKGRDEEKR